MGRVALVESFEKRTQGDASFLSVKCKPGGGADVNAHNYSNPGDDSPPLQGDYAILEDTPHGNKECIVGFIDPNNEHLAEGGERRIYARDESGAVVVTLWLKKDGSYEVYNDKGSSKISADGTIEHENASGAKTTIGNDGSIVNETGPLTTTASIDGAFAVVNALGNFSLTAAGVFLVNGVQIGPAGSIVSPTSISAPSVIAAGKELTGHNHNETGSITGPNN